MSPQTLTAVVPLRGTLLPQQTVQLPLQTSSPCILCTHTHNYKSQCIIQMQYETQCSKNVMPSCCVTHVIMTAVLARVLHEIDTPLRVVLHLLLFQSNQFCHNKPSYWQAGGRAAVPWSNVQPGGERCAGSMQKLHFCGLLLPEAGLLLA